MCIRDRLKTAHLNRLLAQAEGTDFDELLNISTLRSMPQAFYNPQNYGHFGLALRNYAHFTSPIRRYSDLIVHRALISGHSWGDDGLSGWDRENLDETAKLMSEGERRSLAAEGETVDRYPGAHLSGRVGGSGGREGGGGSRAERAGGRRQWYRRPGVRWGQVERCKCRARRIP